MIFLILLLTSESDSASLLIFQEASATIINASQLYCRKGFIQALYTAFTIDLELHLLPASLFRTFSFFNTVSFSCLLYIVSSHGDTINHRSNNLKKERQHRLMKWGSRVPHNHSSNTIPFTRRPHNWRPRSTVIQHQ